MAKRSVSSKIVNGLRTCDKCLQAKTLSGFPSNDAITCSSCIRIAAAFPEVQEHVAESLDSGPKTAIPVVEIDHDHPTTQELAARTLARRRLLSFIQRCKPKYMPGWVHETFAGVLSASCKMWNRKKSPDCC